MNRNQFQKTICVHSGTIDDIQNHGRVSPIYPSSSYEYLDLDKKAYPRYFNTPNQEALVKKICALEHAEDGLVFSSGMAAISTSLLSFLKKGEHVLFQKGLYGGTTNFINTCLNDFDLHFTITNSNDPKDFEKAISPVTKVIYIETPSNPLMSITDIKAVSELARSCNIITMIDNTFASPINQNPIDLGIDIVIHSATKYLGGHSDICAGVVVSTKENMQRILGRARNFGGSLNAQTCYLLERSIKTMALRVNQQNSNAQKIAEFLENHPKINKVYYPGLESHEGHLIAKKQMYGFGGMLSFELNELIDPIQFQKSLKLIHPAMSLGGVESTICSSALTSHALLTKEQRELEGIKDGLLRLSVGIEEAADLIEDLQQALNKM